MKKILVILACIMLFATITACNEAPEAPPVEVPTAEAPQPVEPVPAEPEQEQGQEQEPIEEPVPEPEINEDAEPLLPAYLELFATRDYFEDSSFVLTEHYEGDITELPELGVAEIVSLITELLEWSEEAATRVTTWMAGDTALIRVEGAYGVHHDVYFDGMAFVEWTSTPEFSGVLWEVHPDDAARVGLLIENMGTFHPDSVYELHSIISVEHDGMAIQLEEYLVISARTEPYAARFVFIDGQLAGWVQRIITVRLHEFRQGADTAIIEEFMNMPISDYYADTSEWGQVWFY